MYSDLLSEVRSTQDRNLLLSEVEALKTSLFEPKDGGFEAAMKNEVRASIATKIRSGVEKSGDAEKYLTGLITELKSLKDLKISLAIEPTENILSSIYSWIEKNLGAGLVLDIEVDSKLIAGAVISYKGKYYDGSLSKIVENAFTPQK